MNVTTASFGCEVSIKSHVATRHSRSNQAITQLLDRRRDDAEITEQASNLGAKDGESGKEVKSVLLTFSQSRRVDRIPRWFQTLQITLNSLI
jgi:hypothetical protein